MSVMGVESAFTIMFGCFMVGGFGYPATSKLIMSEICRLQMSRWDLRLCLLETPWSPQEAARYGGSCNYGVGYKEGKYEAFYASVNHSKASVSSLGFEAYILCMS